MKRKAQRICIVQSVAKQYRAKFYAELWAALSKRGIELRVVYSRPNRREAMRGDCVDLPTAFGKEVLGVWLFGGRILYQPIWEDIAWADLVIIEQANKYLMNFVLLILAKLRLKKVAYWGHGKNFQSVRDGTFGETLKRILSTKVDWWFAYTDATHRLIVENGFPSERVTVVNNAIDTTSLANAIRAIGEKDAAMLRKELGLQGEDVCIYCGSLHADKMLPFLISACARIRKRNQQFELLVVGDGPERRLIAEAMQRYPWIHYVGARFGESRARYFRISKMQLMPGLVGLGLVDSFAAGVPLVTTTIARHSPEIEYLQNGVNGLITDGDEDKFADVVDKYLHDDNARLILVEGCLTSADRFSVGMMVKRFSEGVEQCLQSA